VTAEAAADSVVIYWSHEIIQALVQRFSRLALNALKIVAGNLREFQNRYRELATERVERRLARNVLRLASQTGRKTDEGVLLDLPLTRQDLAEMSGTTLFTVSRILSQWESQGLVRASREKLVITFPHGLVRIAEDLPQRTSPPAPSPTGTERG
jgi:CRP-like cAMP-binding protein